LKEYKEAEKAYKNSKKHSNNNKLNIDIALARSYIELRVKDKKYLEKSEKILKELLTDYSNNEIVYLIYGNLKEKSDKLNEAKEFYEVSFNNYIIKL